MILLYEHDCGIDGWDASSHIVAVYETSEAAIAALFHAGYSVEENGNYHHNDQRKRYIMNEISYYLVPVVYNEYGFPHK